MARENDRGRTVLLTGACRVPGPQLVLHFARAKARVIALDRDADGLAALSAACPTFIETLATGDCDETLLRHFADAWQAEPIDVMLNLLPLGGGPDINRQVSVTAALLRAMGRGLIAGRGVLITIAERPRNPFALAGHGLVGALAAVHDQWAAGSGRLGMRTHLLTIPADAGARARDTAIFLAGRPGLDSGRIDLGAP